MFEQLGYQEENALYRNLYLSGAKELRVGGSIPNALTTSSPEVIAAPSPNLFMAYLSMIVDQSKAEKLGNHVINVDMKGEGKFRLDLHNGVLNYVEGYAADKPDASLSISKLDLVAVASGKAKLDDLAKDGKATITGNRQVLNQIASAFDKGMKNDMNLVLPLQDANRIK